VTPARERGVEYLDDPATPEAVRRDALKDLERSNALFGGRAAVLRPLLALAPALPRHALLLDVGAGAGEIAERARVALAWAGVDARVVGVDAVASVIRAARPRLHAGVAADALRLPVRDRGADVVICSQLLHHFEHDDAVALIAELHRVARGWVVIADLRRSRLAAGLFRIAGLALNFHHVTRHDGVVSVMRGFSADELAGLVRQATGTTPTMRRGLFWRISATWRAGTADGA